MYVFEWSMKAPPVSFDWLGNDTQTIEAAYRNSGTSLAGVAGVRGPQQMFFQTSQPAEQTYPQIWFRDNGDGTWTEFVSTGA